MSAYISDEDRVVLIEDTAEIQTDKPNLVRFEARL
jgi:Flp pilus assembly CpaF family ATPase